MVYSGKNEIYILSLHFVFFQISRKLIVLFFYNFRIDVTTIPEIQPVIKPDSDGFQTVVNRKKKRAFFKNMLTIKQINEEFDRKEKEIMEEMEVSGMNFEFRNKKYLVIITNF